MMFLVGYTIEAFHCTYVTVFFGTLKCEYSVVIIELTQKGQLVLHGIKDPINRSKPFAI